LLLTDLTGATEDAAQQQAKSLVLGWVGGKSQAQLNDLARTWSRFIDQKIFW
jgi:hypothetical protein